MVNNNIHPCIGVNIVYKIITKYIVFVQVDILITIKLAN